MLRNSWKLLWCLAVVGTLSQAANGADLVEIATTFVLAERADPAFKAIVDRLQGTWCFTYLECNGKSKELGICKTLVFEGDIYTWGERRL